MIERFTIQRNLQDRTISAKRKFIQGSYRSHFHEFLEIEYILSGSGTYCIDGQIYPIAPGMLFFMSPINFHKVQVSGRAEVFNVMFSEGLCDPYYLTHALSGGNTALSCVKDAPYLEALFSELTRSAEDKALASHILSCILAKIGKYPPAAHVTASPISEISLFVLRNFRSAPPLKEAAARAGFTPSYFSRLFKEQMGISYKHFLDDTRFEYAKKLLLFTDMTVLQVCMESGFSDYTNFVRRFGIRYGKSPSAFRLANQNSDPLT